MFKEGQESMNFVYEVTRDVPGMGTCSMGLFLSEASAQEEAEKWNKEITHPWDKASVHKREVRK